MGKPLLVGDRGLRIFAGQDAQSREHMEILLNALLQIKAGQYDAAEKSIIEAMSNTTEQQAVINYLRAQNISSAEDLLQDLGHWIHELNEGKGDETNT